MFWNRVKQITPNEAKILIEQEDAIVVDVRRPKDYELSHIDGALLADNRHVHEKIDASKKSVPIICYCYRGASSKAACKSLTKSGFSRALNLKGGYAAWSKVFPSESVQ